MRQRHPIGFVALQMIVEVVARNKGLYPIGKLTGQHPVERTRDMFQLTRQRVAPQA